jgi:FMN phosphatase YigB (HAD superfamily)
MNIVIDFDNTLVQTNKAVLEVYRKETNDYSTNLSMLNSWWFDEICPKFTREQQNELFNNPRLFELL